MMPSRDKYSDEHRIFLQGMMCRGVLDTKEVNDLLQRTLKSCNTEIPEKKSECLALIQDMVVTINGEISKLGLIIRKGQDEDTGKPCFMLINNSNRINARVQSQWAAMELEYLRLVATEILQADNKVISNMIAINLTHQEKTGARG